MAAQLQLFEARQSADRWTVRVSHRARRLSVRVYPGGRVEVVAPPHASAAAVERFVGVHREWIDRRVEDLSAVACGEGMRPQAVDLPAIARRWVVHYEPRPTPRVRIEASQPGGRLTLHGAVHDERLVCEALREWLMRQAASALEPELARVAAACGFDYRRLQVRRQRTRWGSCSASGTISLNACVLFLEPAVMRYLMVHELSHTRHMNHSKRFWALVSAHEPEYRRLDKELTAGWRRVPAWVFG